MSLVKRIVPLFDRILVSKIEPVTKTSGGLVLPTTTKLNQFRVLAAGPGARRADGKVNEMSVKVGQTVLVNEGFGTEVSDTDSAASGEKVFLYRESDVLGIVKDE
jgi:chaperonin GroES